MYHFAMGLTHCYKTTVFLHLFISATVKASNFKFGIQLGLGE